MFDGKPVSPNAGTSKMIEKKTALAPDTLYRRKCDRESVGYMVKEEQWKGQSQYSIDGSNTKLYYDIAIEPIPEAAIDLVAGRKRSNEIDEAYTLGWDQGYTPSYGAGFSDGLACWSGWQIAALALSTSGLLFVSGAVLYLLQ